MRRFSDLSGKMNSDIFLQSYKFLDEYQVCIRATKSAWCVLVTATIAVYISWFFM